MNRPSGSKSALLIPLFLGSPLDAASILPSSVPLASRFPDTSYPLCGAGKRQSQVSRLVSIREEVEKASVGRAEVHVG